jgi:hypothetical protein
MMDEGILIKSLFISKPNATSPITGKMLLEEKRALVNIRVR